jgi:RNA polymerase primary sigma factor
MTKTTRSRKQDNAPVHGQLRKFTPTSKLPTETVLRNLTPEDRELLERRLTEMMECIYHPSFRRATVPGEDSDLARIASRDVQPVVAMESDDAPVAHIVPAEVLSAAEERLLFMRFNYCRHQVMKILRANRGQRLTAAATRELLHWERHAQQTRSDIVRANTSLVLAMARRSRNSGVELSELVSEGNLALLRCVDKFDATRGFKFSTYACRAILASFSRAAAKSSRLRAHFPATFDPAMERSDYLDRKRERIEAECVDELRQILFDNSAELSSVERRVLGVRFSLDRDEPVKPGERRKTLDQVGTMLGVSKERVRQIQNQAMNKLRAVLEERLPAAS